MSELTIEVQARAETGKNVNRRLRAAGLIPAVVYGDQKEAVPIQVEQRAIETLLRTGGGENAVFLLKLAGTKDSRHAMIRDLQVDTVRGDMLHIDFFRINMKEKVQVEVPIEIQGVADGVRNQGGILDFVTRELAVECLPKDIPERIAVDVNALEIGDHVEAGQLELPKGVELLEEADRVLVSIHAPRVEEVEEPEEEALLEAPKEEPEVIGQQADE